MSQQETQEVEFTPIARAQGDTAKERRCMSCGKQFASEGWHNRLCNGCQKRSVPYDSIGMNAR